MVDPVYNPQNDRWICIEDVGDAGNEDPTNTGKFIGRSKHPATAMFFGAVVSTGETSPPVWFKAGFRLGANESIKVLKKH